MTPISPFPSLSWALTSECMPSAVLKKKKFFEMIWYYCKCVSDWRWPGMPSRAQVMLWHSALSTVIWVGLVPLNILVPVLESSSPCPRTAPHLKYRYTDHMTVLNKSGYHLCAFLYRVLSGSSCTNFSVNYCICMYADVGSPRSVHGCGSSRPSVSQSPGG